MGSISAIGSYNGFGLLSHAQVSLRATGRLVRQQQNESAVASQLPSSSTLRKVVRLSEALKALTPSRLRPSVRNGIVASAPIYATAIAKTGLDFGPEAATNLRSVEEVNTAPTSFTKFGPNLVGSTATAPWSGPGSTAEATVGGEYDGSNGTGRLTFRVAREGTHGQDDLRIKVYDDNGEKIERIDIKKQDPLNKVYTLSNGLNLTLGAGDIVNPEEFTVDLSLLDTSYTPNQPVWSGSTALAAMGGTYDGSNGTGQLTFQVTRGGTHGSDDLKLKIYAPDDSFVETINVKRNDAIDKIYGLSNGLSFTLGEGDLIKDETFTVDVDAADPLASRPAQPQWIVSSASATIAGHYDGSLGSGAMTFRANNSGTHGQDDLTIKVYAPDDSFLENIKVDKDDPLDKTYSLSNGLTFTLSAGDLIKNETFAVDLHAATSFSTTPHPLESTAEVTIGGVYNGSQGTGQLSFLITQGGTHGTDNLSLDVYAPDDTLLEAINIQAADPSDRVYQLSNGLTFQLGEGKLVVDETFSVSVSDQIGSRVDPEKPFSGTRNQIPNFDIGQTVTAGSFDVNGVTIDVFAGDTLNGVLDRITQSNADVSATFDADSETVFLTRKTAGTAHSIVLANDTSGFLAATKLVGATPTNATDTTSTPIAEIGSLADVSSGSLLINSVTISLDVMTDSIDAVVGRINASAANVTAGFDTATNRLSIVANEVEALALDGGGTGFFEALAIDAGTYQSTPGQTEAPHAAMLSQLNRRHVAKAVHDVSRALNRLFEDPDFAVPDASLEAVRSAVREAIGQSIESDGTEFNTDFGFRFDFEPSRDGVFRFAHGNMRKLLSSLKSSTGAAAFRELMFGKSEKVPGLADRLIAVTKAAQRDITLQLGTAGRLVDIYA